MIINVNKPYNEKLKDSLKPGSWLSFIILEQMIAKISRYIYFIEKQKKRKRNNFNLENLDFLNIENIQKKRKKEKEKSSKKRKFDC